MPWQWSSWASLGGELAGAPAAVRAQNGRLVVLWRGTDNALWHRWQDPDFAWRVPPVSLGELPGAPAALLAANGRLVVFWRGTDNALWHRWQDPDFAWREPPMSLGGELAGDPAAVLAENGRLVVFWRGTDNALWHRWQDPDFAWREPPMSLGDVMVDSPAAVLAENGRLVVFWRGADNALWHRWQDPDFAWRQPPMSLGGELTAAPAAVLTEIRRMGAFWRGADNALWHRRQDREFAWGEAASLGGQLTSGPAAARAEGGGLAAFGRGTDNAIWYREQRRPFLMGAATAGRQNEGGITNDDWEIFTTNPLITTRVTVLGNVPTPPQNFDPRPAGDAVRHASLSTLNQDLERARLLGMNAYRFSIEWSRIEPTATGGLRAAPLDDYYVPAIRGMLARGIEPVVTLNHLSLPSWVLTPPARTRTGVLHGVSADPSDPGFQSSLRGWQNRDTVDRYIEYVRFVAARLAREGVRYWITLNEPVNSMIAVGFLAGVWPPGFALEGRGGFEAYFNVLRAHVRAFDAIKEIDPSAQVSIAHNMMLAEPAEPGDEDATRQLDYFYHWHFLDALTQGTVDPKIDVFNPGAEPAETFFALGAGTWSPKLDFVGVNYYRKTFISQNAVLGLSGAAYAGGFPADTGRTTGLTSALRWTIFPAGLDQLLRRIHERYLLPIMITENGTSEPEDHDRGSYIVAHLKQIRRLNATPNGPRVIGYLYWTLVDNWEWIYHYEPRAHFGLYNIDRSASDQPRRLTDGALAFRYLALGAPNARAKQRFGAITDSGDRVEPPTRSPGSLWQGPIDDGRPFALYLTRPTRDRLNGMLFDGTIGAWVALNRVRWDRRARRLTMFHSGRDGLPERRFEIGMATSGDLSGFFTERGVRRRWSATRMWLDGLWTNSLPIGLFALSFTSKWERSGSAGPEAWRGKRLLDRSWSLFDRVTWDGTTLGIVYTGMVRRTPTRVALTATLADERLTGTVESSTDPLVSTGSSWEAVRAPDEVLPI